MSEVNDSWIKPELKREMESLAGFMHPLNEADREIFREGFRSALATIKYDDLHSQLEACKKERDEANINLEQCRRERDHIGARHNEWMQGYIKLSNEKVEFEQKLTEAVKALEYYAAPKDFKSYSGDFDWQHPPGKIGKVAMFGKLARETLAKIKVTGIKPSELPPIQSASLMES